MPATIDDTTVTKELEKLTSLSEEKLIEELGIRKFAAEKTPALENEVAPVLTYDAKAMGPLDGVRALGRAVLVRWAKELQELICGSDTASQEQRDKLLGAFGTGKIAGGALLASGLIAIGCPALLAPVVAAIVVSRFVGSAIDVFCKESKGWVDQLS